MNNLNEEIKKLEDELEKLDSLFKHCCDTNTVCGYSDRCLNDCSQKPIEILNLIITKHEKLNFLLDEKYNQSKLETIVKKNLEDLKIYIKENIS